MISLINEVMPPKKHPIYVAVSMGVDSLAACFYLRSKGYQVIPLHFNHKMRPQNDEMEDAFLEVLGEYGYRYHGRFEIGHGKGLKTESECREARLQFFKDASVPKAEDFEKIIVTAHHLDDYQESYLLNCFRGHPEYKPMNLVSDFVSFKIIHPFLLTEKKDFVQFVERWDNGKLKKYLTKDETNDTIKGSRRNWVRNIIVPEMEKAKVSLKKHCKDLIKKSICEISGDC